MPKAPEQVWVADITYLPTAGPFVYLSLVTDAFSRKIVGYHVHDSLQTEQVSQALKKALRTRRSRQPLIHHSDRGIQYCSTYYQDIHRRHGLRCSMTDGYDCYQNALAERINGILKGEFLLHRPADLKQAAKMVEQSVNIYNCERPHAASKRPMRCIGRLAVNTVNLFQDLTAGLQAKRIVTRPQAVCAGNKNRSEERLFEARVARAGVT